MAFHLSDEDGALIGAALCLVGGALVGKKMIDFAAEGRERARAKLPAAEKKKSSAFDDKIKFVGVVFSLFVMVRDAPLIIDGLKAIQKELPELP